MNNYQIPYNMNNLNNMNYQYPYYAQNNIRQPITNNIPNTTLQGKSVESIDVVKALDIPLDESISYFPLANGSAIVTKQLQTDGTSKTLGRLESFVKKLKYPLTILFYFVII